MKTQSVMILLAAAVVVGGAGLFIAQRERSATQAQSDVPATLFPGLGAKVNDVALIEIKRPGETFAVARTGNEWGLATKSGFPVNIEQVKSAVVGVSQLKPIETKTSNPALYSKIGVQDPGDAPVPPADPSMNPEEAPPTQPTLVTLKDANGATLASVIVGTQKWGTTPSVFVRKAGDAQSWLAEGRIEVPTDAMQWIERQVLNIGRERIRSATVVHPDGATLEVSREKATDSGFTVKNIPAGRELSAPTAPESVVTGVQYFSIDDVVPVEQVDFSAFTSIATYRTFDGLVITVESAKKDTKDWVSLSFAYEEPPPPATPEPVTPEAAPPPAAPGLKSADEVKKEVVDLTARLSKWAFAVPEHKARSFAARIDTLLKPPAPPTSPVPTVPTPEGPAPEGPSGQP